MKLFSARRPGGQRGSATLVVFALLAIMGVVIVCNTRVLDSLQGELRLLEEKQKQKFAPQPAPQTPKRP